MASPSTNLKASASFDVRPVRSQVVLVGLIVAAIIALIIGGALLGLDKPSGWPFVMISAFICTSVVLCWRQSQRDTDLAQSHPTKVVLADGANLSTDSRLLSSPESVRNFSQVLQALALRQPLPEPSGLAGPGAMPIPNSKQEAVEIVAGINADTQRSHNQAISVLQAQLVSDVVFQASVDGGELPCGATRELGNLNALLKESPAKPTGNDAF